MSIKRKDLDFIEDDELKRRILDLIHGETDELRDQIDSLNSQLEEAKNNVEAAKASETKAKTDLESYKSDVAAKETRSAKSKAVETLAKEIGVSDKYLATVLKATDLDSVELDESGKIKGLKEYSETFKSEWADFITATETHGAEVEVPPAESQPSMTKAQFEAAGYKTRLELKQTNPELYREYTN